TAAGSRCGRGVRASRWSWASPTPRRATRPTRSRCGSPTRAPASRRKRRTAFSSPSIRPSRRAPAWGSPSLSESSRRTAAASRCRAASARGASSSSASLPPPRSTPPAASASPRPLCRSPASNPPARKNPSRSPPPSPAKAARPKSVTGSAGGWERGRLGAREDPNRLRALWCSGLSRAPVSPALPVKLLVLLEDGPAAAEGFGGEGAAGGGGDHDRNAGGGKQGQVAGVGIAAGEDQRAETGDRLELALRIGDRVEYLVGEAAVPDAHLDPRDLGEAGQRPRGTDDGERARRDHHRQQPGGGARCSQLLRRAHQARWNPGARESIRLGR